MPDSSVGRPGPIGRRASIHAPKPLDDVVRHRMERQGRRDTAPELAVRRAVHALGLRYFVDRSPIAGMRSRADLVFPRARVAVFVDGCFWHGCPTHATAPKNNSAWWRTKLDANIARDRRIDSVLTTAGWLPLRFWEHESAKDAAQIIEQVVRRRGQGPT